MKISVFIGVFLMFLCSVKAVKLPIDLNDAVQDDPLVIKTQYGYVRGVEEDGVRIWRGIPYAAAPVGSLRWKSPQPALSWSDTRDCSEFGKICTQIHDGYVTGSEDCLFVNVYIPANATGPLPVLFWIYGGGFNDGDGYLEGLYNGIDLARTQNLVVVTHNYRLNAFGFLGTYELAAVNGGSTGNYGVQDQTFALQWVQANIAGFGGLPSSVMIYGQSAGGMSVCFHLGSADSYGLFHSAIMESGTCDNIDFFSTLENRDSLSDDYATGFGCPRDDFTTDDQYLNCLLAADWATVATAKPIGDGYRSRLVPNYYWGPTIDGTKGGLTDYPIFVIESGDWANVPFIAGFNRDEGSMFVPAIPDMVPNVTVPLDEDEVRLTLEHFFPDDVVDQLMQVYYPRRNYPTADAQAAAMLRDYMFGCATRRVVNRTSTQGFPSWMYHFVYANDWPDYKLAGDYHAFELFFVFDNQWPRGVHNFTAADQSVANLCGNYWGNMGYSANPNKGPDGQFPVWPNFDTTTAYNLAIDNPPYTEQFLFKTNCDYWDQVFEMETGGTRKK